MSPKPTATGHRISPEELTPAQRAAYEKMRAKAKTDLEAGLEGPPADVDMTDAAPFYFELRACVAELKKAREAAGLTLAQVAEKTGLAVETLSRLETGAATNPTWQTLGRYAAAVGRKLTLRAGATPMFELGHRYTREEINAQVGGGLVEFLPNRDGRVVAACLNPEMNPNAPYVIVPGEGEGVERSALLLVGQSTPVPTFLRQAANEWEYVGDFVCCRYSRAPDEIAALSRGLDQERDHRRITMVIYMQRVGPQPRGNG